MRLHSKLTSVIIVLSSATLLFSCAKGPTEPEQRDFSLDYTVDLSNLPGDAGSVEIWIPLPQDNARQTVEYRLDSSLMRSIETDSEYGNKVLVIKSDAASIPNRKLDLSMIIHRREARALTDDKKLNIMPGNQLVARFLAPDSLVPIGGKIAGEARDVAGRETTVLGKARALYNHLATTMTYDKSGEGWGRGDALYACDVRRGNCTDFHSLFIGQARSLNIPARFIIGFPLPTDVHEGTISGYHCWAEFYDADRGWVPVDISEASKHPEKKDYLFGNLDPDRVAFTMGRDIPLPDDSSHTKLNYFVFPKVRVDGTWFDDFTTAVSFKDIM